MMHTLDYEISVNIVTRWIMTAMWSDGLTLWYWRDWRELKIEVRYSHQTIEFSLELAASKASATNEIRWNVTLELYCAAPCVLTRYWPKHMILSYFISGVKTHRINDQYVLQPDTLTHWPKKSTSKVSLRVSRYINILRVRVCERILGLALLILIVRFYGNELYYLFNVRRF